MADEALVLSSIDDGVCTLTLNNPERRNAWSVAMEARYFGLLDDAVASDDVRDPSQQRLELLVGYDRRRGTQLLDTLEGYLDHRGNVIGTSRALFIHPNTLRQRLDRIQREAGIDLDHEDWLSLAVATKVVKLNRMRGSTAHGRGEYD